MAEVIKRQEVQATPEIIKFKQLLGMQGRLILADQKYLNPDIKDVPPIDASNPTADFQSRNYNPFENTSRFDRREYWQKQVTENKASADFNSQLETWKTSLVSTFKNESNQEKKEKLKPYFSKIGINLDNFENAEASTFYSRYFQNGASGVKSFVKDIIETYDNAQSLKSSLTDIQWLANIFGGKSSEIVAQLVDAEVNLLTDPQFAEKLNQKNNKDKTPLNNLSDKEIDLLNHICAHCDNDASQENQNGKKQENGPLPIMAYEAEIKGHLSNPNVDSIIISAGTGTGKTTQIPQMAMDVMKKGQKMFVTSPRKFPMKDLAARIAYESGNELGEEVGYIHGEGQEVNKEKGIVCVITEGSLKRAIGRDKTGLLLDYDKIMFDEVHEMSKDLQLTMALALKIQEKRRTIGRPLQLIFSSATSNKEAMKRFLPGAALVEVPGTTAPINETFETTSIPRDEKPARAAFWTRELIKKKPIGRTILIFMPGDTLIRETVNKINELNLPNVKVRALSGSLPKELQEEAKTADPNVYNIIVSSPLAETSITIPDIDVISSGYVNIPRIDEDTGLIFLEEQLHSRKGLTQQKGRGGRTGESDFIFLGTRDEWEKGVTENGVFKVRPEFAPNPLSQTDLIDAVLCLKALGEDFDQLRFMEKPNPKNLVRATRQLKALGALNPDGSVTDIGKQMDKIPTDPHVARMIIEAKNKGCGEAACSIAAMIEARVLFVKPDKDHSEDKIRASGDSFKVEGSDFLTLLNIWRAYSRVSEDQRKTWVDDHCLRGDVLERVTSRRLELLKKTGTTDSDNGVSSETIEKCVAVGFKDKLLRRNASVWTGRRKPRTTYSLADEPVSNAAISKGSALMNDNYEMFVSMGNYSRQQENKRQIIYMVNNQRVDPSWL
ncbi:MAG: ATP-dependent RNA helicase [Candidatus Roizmanbacteria bacterium]|nr:MAG: ATP-dependent RNA helicase [Candidatus Roizmanbacteria bacterium]